MKPYILSLALLACTFSALHLRAQVRGINYQAVARTNAGTLIANQNLNLRIFIREATASGTAVYEETHTALTNAYGLFSVGIGAGTVVNGNFSSIDWASNRYFIETQINGVSIGTSELLAVPYAKVATDMKLSTLTDVGSAAPATGQALRWNGSEWTPAPDNAGSNPWAINGTAISYVAGNVGIGDATPAATLTVGDGDKLQVNGTDGDVIFSDDNATIRFPATTLPNSPMLQMFSSGTQNASRMLVSHSPAFPNWGIEYKDTTDVMYFRDGSVRKFAFELGSGHMGIGVDDPAFPLDGVGRMRLRADGNLNNSPGIWFQNNTGTFDRAFFGMSEPDSLIGIYSQHLGKWAIEFEVMREPRIGINIPAGSPPRAELHLYHTNFGGSNDGIRIQNEGSNAHYWNLYTSNTTGDFEFFKQGIKRATINQTSGAYTAVSDARLKTDVSLLGSVLPNVMNLQAKTYQYTGTNDPRYFTGFIAQELEKEFPQFVYFGGDDQKYYTVDYAGMSVVALKAIQEQQSEIERLNKELAELKTLVQQIASQK